MTLTDPDASPGIARDVFVFDARVPEIDRLVATLPEGSLWFVLDDREDGLTQVATLLEGLAAEGSGRIAAVHLVSHGAPGVLLLGDGPIDLDGLAPEAEVLAGIGALMAPDGELRLYGCAVGLGAEGDAFVDTLARLSGIRVAASDDPTGAGGNWRLETRSAPFDGAATDEENVAAGGSAQDAAAPPDWPGDASALSAYAATLWIHQDQPFGTGRYLTGGGLVQGGPGNDLIAGDEGSRREYVDPFTGLWVYSPVEGYDLRDTLVGGAGDDSLYGRNGDDQLYGDAGNDLLDSGLGNNLLVPGAGSDTIHGGGTGIDTLRLGGRFGPAPAGTVSWEIEIEPASTGSDHLAAYDALSGDVDLFRDIDRIAFDDRVVEAGALREPDTGRLRITDVAWRLRGDADASAVPVTRTPGFGAPKLGPFSLDGRIDFHCAIVSENDHDNTAAALATADSARVHGTLSWASRITLTLDGEAFDPGTGEAVFATPPRLRLAGLDLGLGAMALDGEQALLSATVTPPASLGTVRPLDGAGLDAADGAAEDGSQRLGLGVRLLLTPDTLDAVGDDLRPGCPVPETGLRLADTIDVTLSQGVLRYLLADDAFTLDGVFNVAASGTLPALAFRAIDDAGTATVLRIVDGTLQPATLRATPADFALAGTGFSDLRFALPLGTVGAPLSGSAVVTLPFAPDASPVPAELELRAAPLALTGAWIDHTPETPIRILSTPVSVTDLEGRLGGLDDASAGARFTGTATLAIGASDDPLRVTLTGGLDAASAHGRIAGGRAGRIDLDGEATLDWDADTLAFDGTVSMFDGRIRAPLRFESPLEVELAAFGVGRADLGAGAGPANIALAWSEDGDAANDRIDAWIRIDATFGAPGESPRSESLAIGRTYGAEGAMTRLGADPLPGDGGWRVEDGAAGLLIEARWETPETAPVRTRIVVADATAAQPPRILEESDYAAHGITLIDALGGASGRAVWIAEPLAGDYAYDLELVTETAIGVVTRSAAVTRTPMRFDTITATLDADALRIDYGAVTGESSGAMLRFFVDDDGTGFDGRPVGGPVPVDPGGRVTLAMPPLAAGRYWLYGVLSEEGSAPFLDYAPSPVTVRTSGVLPPELAISPVAAELPEGDDGVTRFAFRVTRSGDLTGESTLRWTVDPDDANASDFVGTGLPSGLLGFAVGQVEATITVEVAGDTTPESDERFAVTLSDPTDARVTTATAQATIRNDDLPPAVVLTGTAASEVLQGGPDDETLIGGGGNDTLIGGAGNDTLVVDSVSDVVVELAGGGIDTVVSGVTRTLGEHQENLVLTGAANLDGTGNALANRIIGNAGNNVLRGLFGADTLEGGAGHDTYVLDSAQDVVIERDGEGTDTVMAPVAWTLGPNLENLVLTGPASVAGTGNALANRIDGNTGDNTLTGGGGADTLAGGTGDDTHVVDSADDLVIELAGGGTDTVRASVTRTLGDQQEHLTLTGDRAIDGIGNALTNRIEGNTAANTLTGLAGADTLLGGDGADVFRFVARGDSTLGAVDTILDFGAGDRLVLEGSAGLARATDSVTWAGSPGATISAIRARTGLADRIVTFDDGVDTFVYVNGAGSGVSFDGTLVRLTGRTATPTVDGIVPPPARDLSRTGTDAAETLQGGDGDDTLTGLGGNDTLEGLAGDDRLDGGDGIDWAVFSGALSGYTLRGDGAHVEVTDLAPDREGTDTVTSIERLQFADLGVNLTIQAAAASIDPAALDRIAELYVGFFGRVPAADGLENWILQHRAGRTLSAIADDFHAIGTSPALRERTGYWDLDADAPLSDAGYVALIYRNVLGREGKAGGIAYWSAQLRPGDDGAPAAETRGSLVGTMLDAAHALKGDETWGWVAELLEDRVAMSKRIAVEWGLNYGATPEAAITLGAAIAGAVDESPNPDPAFADSPVKTFDFDAAIAIIGVDPARIDLI